MPAGLRNFLWVHFLSKLKIGRAVDAQLRRDAASAPTVGTGNISAAGRADGPLPKYRPDVFDTSDIEAARTIILTPEAGTTTQERWELETPYLVKLIGRTLELNDRSCVLDYGCGIGRISKGLIEAYGCSVIGVDISASMRQLAQQFVQSNRFVACSPELLKTMVAQGFRSTHAIAIWVIQHCASPDVDLAQIESAVTTRGKVFVLNLDVRAIPSDRGWISDNIVVEDLLTKRFEKIEKGRLPESVTTPEIARISYTMTLKKRK